MKETQYGRIISQEISDVVGNLDQEQLAALVDAIVAAKRVFACGGGLCGGGDCHPGNR